MKTRTENPCALEKRALPWPLPRRIHVLTALHGLHAVDGCSGFKHCVRRSVPQQNRFKMQALGDRVLLAPGGAHPALLETVRAACRDDGNLCILVNVAVHRLEERLLAAGVPRYRLPRALTYAAKASIRSSFYKGVVQANSWVLAADALSGVLDVEKVATVIVGGCEKLDAAALLFLRLFRERRFLRRFPKHNAFCRSSSRLMAFSGRCAALHREPQRLDGLHLVNYEIEVAADANVSVVTRTASTSIAQKRQEAALRRLASAVAAPLRRAVLDSPRDVWSNEFAADCKHAVPLKRRHNFNDRPVRDLGAIRRLAIETCSADASSALEALEVFARRNMQARDPRAWVGSKDYDSCVDACRLRATPRQVEAPPKWALVEEALCNVEGRVCVLVASRGQAQSVASFLKLGAEAACLRLRRRLVARTLPHLPSKSSRDTPYQALVRAELDDALDERNDDGDAALADALAISLEEAEDDSIKAAIAASLARRRSSMLGPPPPRAPAASLPESEDEGTQIVPESEDEYEGTQIVAPPPPRPALEATQRFTDPEETCLSPPPPPAAPASALERALAASARNAGDAGLQRALALSAAEARGPEVVDLTLSQASEPDRGLSRTADDTQLEATQLEETQLLAPRRSVVDVSVSPPDAAAVRASLAGGGWRGPPTPADDDSPAFKLPTDNDDAPAAPRRSVVDVTASPPEGAAAAPTDAATARPPAVYVVTAEQLMHTSLDALRPHKVIVYDVYAPALLRHAKRYAATRCVALERLVLPGSLEATLGTQTEARDALALQELQSLPKFASTLTPPASDAPLIVVDARELRSEVPRALYDKGLRLAVATLTVADFVLSSSLAVERKSVDTNDLSGSLESGRLWKQLRALGAAYATPALLIEFRDRCRPLDAPTTYLSLKHTQDGLVKAVLEFPRTRVFWTPTAAATAGLFAALAAEGNAPDIKTAQNHRDDGDAMFRFLGKVPGLEPPRPDLGGRSLAQLASLDSAALTKILGSERARRFAAFCTRPMEPLPLEEVGNRPKKRRKL